ncbi:MAG: TetR/AcrR family transcriptional regulator [Planctomycetota bacterium]|nr:TetR/AcrR family transcriptional regulator [Planctomycetota bacterium]
MKLSESTSTRDRLIEAARDLFLQQGYSATGIAQILREANAKPGSLYHFFPTKEDLLIAVLESYTQLLWPLVIKPVFDRVSDPIERIFGILDGYRRMLQLTTCTKGCPIGNIVLELADTHPHVRELCATNFTGWRKAIEGCLDDAANRLPQSVDRIDLASFVLTVMEGGVMQARAYQTLEPFDVAVLQLRDYFDRLLDDGTTWSTQTPPNRIDPE